MTEYPSAEPPTTGAPRKLSVWQRFKEWPLIARIGTIGCGGLVALFALFAILGGILWAVDPEGMEEIRADQEQSRIDREAELAEEAEREAEEEAEREAEEQAQAEQDAEDEAQRLADEEAEAERQAEEESAREAEEEEARLAEEEAQAEQEAEEERERSASPTPSPSVTTSPSPGPSQSPSPSPTASRTSTPSQSSSTSRSSSPSASTSDLGARVEEAALASAGVSSFTSMPNSPVRAVTGFEDISNSTLRVFVQENLTDSGRDDVARWLFNMSCASVPETDTIVVRDASGIDSNHYASALSNLPACQ